MLSVVQMHQPPWMTSSIAGDHPQYRRQRMRTKYGKHYRQPRRP